MSVRRFAAAVVAALCLTALPVVAADKADSPPADAARRDDSMNGGGTTSGAKEVARRLEQPPRTAPGDGRDAGGRATQGAVAGAAVEVLADMLLQLEQAQAELRELRGKVEVQAHAIEALKARSRDLIADIDRRLSELERRGATREAAAGAPPAVADAAPANLAQEQQEYDAAFALLKQGQYERAGKRFRDFIRAHPKSPLVDNAQYWVGESAYVVRNFKQALEEFSKVLQSHPDSPKAPDAMLKVGYCYYELADWAKARATLNQVLTRFPNTPAAERAGQRLEKMKKEGR